MLHAFIHTIIQFFIPHEGNDYRPKMLQRVGMIGLFGLVVLSFSAANMQALLWQTSDYLVGAVLPAVVIDLTNKERTTLDIAPVTRNAVLDAAAQLKADDMAKNSYFSHESPTGITPWHWFEVAGYPFVHAGENLAVYFTDSDDVVDAWMNSPTHRANIVNTQYREIGIGTARGRYQGYDTVFVVQLFGTRALPAVVAAPVIPPIVAVRNQPVTSELPTVIPTPLANVPLQTVPTRSNELLPDVVIDDTALAVVPSSPAAPLVAGETIDNEPVITDRSDRTNNTATLIPVNEPNKIMVMETTASPTVVDTPERIIEPGITGSTQALYLNTAASSTDLVPAPLSTVEYSGGTSAPMMARLATEPNRVLQMLYIIVGLLTGIALGTSLLLQWRQHRPVQTVYGISLLIIMCGLFYIHTMVTAGVVIQ